jgi:hypothetical protein
MKLNVSRRQKLTFGCGTTYWEGSGHYLNCMGGQEYDLTIPERALCHMECFSQWFIEV